MALTDLEKVRSLIGDMHKAAVRERVAKSDGLTTEFQLDMFPVRTGTVTIYNTGVAVSALAITYLLGTFTLTAAASASNLILASYQYNALSDDEIQNAIDLASGGGNLLAGAIAARSLAANFARYFSYTQGDKSVDKDKISKKLLDLAESLENAHDKNIQAGGMTVSVMKFDDSGTAFDGYDTGSSTVLEENNGFIP
jgi:hypothetical protein